MFFDHYPYTNFHNVNLDWVLQAVKAWGNTVEANDRAFKDLKEANEDFKRYVRNYLQDLDVSDEINTKLDRMLAEGTLTPYFAPYVKGYVESWLASNVTPTTPALDKTLSIDDAAANAAATGERIEKAAYLRTLDGPKLCNLLNKNLIIPGYRIQSVCNAGGYFYVCGGSEAADGKGFIAKMSSLDFKDAEITYYTDLGHANDITYSYTTNHLYVTTVGEGVEWGIWDINPNDLTDKTLITNCPENTIGIQYVDGWVFVLAPPRIYRTLDFETYTLVINNTNDILNKFSIQSDGRISQTLVRLPNNVVGWVGSYIKEPEHIWYGFIAYFGSHGAITFDVFPTYNAECQAAIWDGKSTVYVISNGTTGPAYTVLRMDCGDLKYLELGAGKDLNDYTGEGLFYLIGAATMNNCPVNNEGLTLKVSRQGLLNTRQDIFTNSGRHLYRIKLFNAGTWGEWVEQGSEIAQIKEDLSAYEAPFNIVKHYGFLKSGTSSNVTYVASTDGKTLTVNSNGVVTSHLFLNIIYNNHTELPSGISAGKSVLIECSTTKTQLSCMIDFYDVNNERIGPTLNINKNTVLTVPANATGAVILIRAARGVAYNNDAITIAIYSSVYDSYAYHEFKNSINYASLPALSLFDTVGIIGDSWSSGTVYTDASAHTSINTLRWGAIASKMYGFTPSFFTFPGATTKKWLTDSRGLTALNDAEEQELYIICLGINDNSGNYTIGSIADADTDADTFYGSYGAIIRAIKAKASNAKIALALIPHYNDSAVVSTYNDAIIALANHFNIAVLNTNADLYFNSASFINNRQYNHLTAVGYTRMAGAINRMLQESFDEYNDYWKYALTE